MDSSGSEDDDFIIRRAPIIPRIVSEDIEHEESGPVTPPLDHSMKLSRSLGLVMSPHSPPYRKVRSMKLIETPKGPLHHSFIDSLEPPTYSSTPDFARGGAIRTPRSLRVQRFRMKHDLKDKLSLSVGPIPSTYVNPFSPYSRTTPGRELKKSRIEKSKLDSDDDSDKSSPNLQRPKMCDFEKPGMFERDFAVLEEIGSGDHGCVFKCLHLLNGWEYAVKRSLQPVHNERMVRNEIDAHAALKHPNIVQSFSCWTEDDYLYMQNEYCNGGNLEEYIKKNGPMQEKELLILLEQLAQGLRYIHSLGLAHMDIKPSNIFLNKGLKLLQRRPDDHPEFKEDDNSIEETVYKIGDLGHVIRQDCTHDVEEGDCRYLPREMLNDTHPNYAKVDIFALGLTIYEAAGGGPLPKNGDEWHRIRDGQIKYFNNMSSQLNRLIKRMIDSDPSKRLSASVILNELFRDNSVQERHQQQLYKHHMDKLYKKRSTLNNNNNVSKPTADTRFTRSTSRLIGKKITKSLSST